MTCIAAVSEEGSCAAETLRHHCRALGVKESTALLQHAETICGGTQVDFSRTYIGATGLQAVTALLARNVRLAELRLCENGLDNDSVVFLCRALKTHGALRLLDLAANPALSLAAGLEVLSLVQHCGTLREVRLEGTTVPAPLRRKIAHAATRNTAVAAVCSPRPRHRTPSQAAAWRAQESALLGTLTAQLRRDGAGVLPMPTVSSGWRALYVTLLAPPGLFVSEKACLLRDVFPRLNHTLRPHRIELVPLIDTHDDDTARHRPGDVRFTVACDLVADVRRSPFIVLELLGDRAGDYAQPPASVMFAADTDVAAALHPVLYTAHTAALKHSRWLLLAQRKPTAQLAVPPSLAPLLSDEPRVSRPDAFGDARRRRVVGGSRANGDASPPVHELVVQRDVETMLWRRHEAFCAHALDTAPTSALTVRHYHAVFDTLDSCGRVRLGELDEFATAVHDRLHVLLTHATQQEGSGNGNDEDDGAAENTALSRQARQRLLCHGYLVQTAAGLTAAADDPCSRLQERLHAYAAASRAGERGTPVLLVHCAHDPQLPRRLLARCALRWRAMPHLGNVAVHFAHARGVCEEPTEGRDVIVNLVQQLSQDAQVRHYVRHEVDLGRLRRFFARFCAVGDDAVRGATTVRRPCSPMLLLLDGMDALDEPVLPCAALGLDAHPDDASHGVTVADLLPTTLGGAVGVIVGGGAATTGPLATLCARGRDKVDAIAVDLDTARAHALAQLTPARLRHTAGVCVGDDDAVIARAKYDAAVAEYQRYLVSRLRSVQEVPGYDADVTEVIRVYPQTVVEAARQVRDAVIAAVGRPVVYQTVGLLRAARWGLRELELARLLPLSRSAFNALLRLLRPVLQDDLPHVEDSPLEDAEGGEGSVLRQMVRGNALLMHLRLCSPAFCEVLYEDLDVAAEQRDMVVWHARLATHYAEVVRRVLAHEHQPPRCASAATDMLEYTAVKELPYHLARASRWAELDALVLSPAYLQLVYRNELAYPYHRDLVAAFNARHERYMLGHDVGTEAGPSTWQRRSEKDAVLPRELRRMRDYVVFVRAYSAKLVALPPHTARAAARLVLQAALDLPTPESYVEQEVRQYVRGLYHPQQDDEVSRAVESVYFVPAPHTAAVHLGAVRDMAYGPNGHHLVSGGADHRLCWRESSATPAAAVRSRVCGGAVERVVWCATSCYVAALLRDRSVAVYDGVHDTLVSQLSGLTLEAPVASLVFSARGRYYAVACEDGTVRVVDTERGRVVQTLRACDLLDDDDAATLHQRRAHVAILADDDDHDEAVWYVVVNARLQRWRIGDGAEQMPTRELSALLPCGALQQTLWCTPAQARGAAAYLLLQPIERGALCVYDAHRQATVLRLATRGVGDDATRTVGDDDAAQPRDRAVVSHDGHHVACVADAPGRGQVLLYTLPWDELLCHDDTCVRGVLTPTRVLTGLSPISLTELAFAGDGGTLFALQPCAHRLLHWDLRPDDMPDSGRDDDSSVAVFSPTGEYASTEPCTAWAVSRGASTEVALGHDSGAVTLLTLWRPSCA